MSAPHVLYRMFNTAGELLYVGITCNPHGRFRQHQIEKSWWLEVRTIKVENLDSREALLEAERLAIIAERPRYNIKDTRHYGTYSLTEIVEMLGAHHGMKHPELWVRRKMREIGHKGKRIDGEVRFTKRQINQLWDYQSSEAIYARKLARKAAEASA